MQSNLRSIIRSFQNTVIENNPLIFTIIRLKHLFNIYREFPQKSSKIAKNIMENQAKLEKAKSLININSQNKIGIIDLIR